MRASRVVSTVLVVLVALVLAGCSEEPGYGDKLVRSGVEKPQVHELPGVDFAWDLRIEPAGDGWRVRGSG